MKKNTIKMLNNVSDKYLSEADPSASRNAVRSRRGLWAGLTAACLTCIVTVMSVFLFIPLKVNKPDISKYESNDYYKVIAKLNTLNYKYPEHKNNFEKLIEGLDGMFSGFNDMKGEASFDGGADNVTNGAMAPEEAVTDDAAGEDIGYKETTDNQVEGVIEADKRKRTDKFIYYLDEDTIKVYNIDREKTALIGEYYIDVQALTDGFGDYNNSGKVQISEFYLTSDCNNIIVMIPYRTVESGEWIGILSLDVSDGNNSEGIPQSKKITKSGFVSISGRYISSRLTNGQLLLVSEYLVSQKNIDFDDEKTFIPQINKGNGSESIPSEDIVLPDELTNLRYTVAAMLDVGNLDVKSTKAFLSYTDDIYCTKEKIYFFRVYADYKDEESESGRKSTVRNSMTEIACYSYDESKFEHLGSVTVRGYVKDQYSLDEYKDVLRVVTTTNKTNIYKSSSGIDVGNITVSNSSILQTATGSSSASLYCIDVKTWKMISSVEDFAPWHEEVRSVRFDGDMAYVCTAIEVSDPVFFFDLSDVNNITYKDTGYIEGFSSSLVNLGNGFLLGIGRADSWQSFKAEVYEETNEGVRSVCAYILDNADYADDYKAYYIDREHQMIGLGITEHGKSNNETRYMLLHFNGYNIYEIANAKLDGDLANMRGVMIDGYMYMFGHDGFEVALVIKNEIT